MEILHKKANEPPQPIAELDRMCPRRWWPWGQGHGAQPERSTAEHGEFARLIREVACPVGDTRAGPAAAAWPQVPFDESWGSQQSWLPAPLRARPGLGIGWCWPRPLW